MCEVEVNDSRGVRATHLDDKRTGMPVKHIVLMKFKADTTAVAMQQAASNLLALKGLWLPGIAMPASHV